MKVKAYKLLARADIELNNVLLMIIFETYLDKESLVDEEYPNLLASFTKQSNEIAFKITKNQIKDNEEFIYWKEFMKYRLTIIDKKQIKKCKLINQLGSYIPYNDTFENLLKENNIDLKEGEVLQLRVFGYDLITPLNEKELILHKIVSNNFQ